MRKHPTKIKHYLGAAERWLNFFYPFSPFFGCMLPVCWTSPPPNTYDFTLFCLPIFFCHYLAALFESEYVSSTGPNTKLEPLCIILCMTLAATLIPLCFYPSPGQLCGHGQCCSCFVFFISDLKNTSFGTFCVFLFPTCVHACF